MKKTKIIDKINFVCFFVEIYYVILTFSIWLSALFEIEIIYEKIIRPFNLYEKFFKPYSILPYIIVFIFFGTAEIFLIIENNKFNKYFFSKFSEKSRRWVMRFSVFSFVLNIITTYLYCIATIF